MATVELSATSPPHINPTMSAKERDELQRAHIASVSEAVRARNPEDPYAGEVIVFPVGGGSALYAVQSTAPPVLVYIALEGGYRLPPSSEAGVDSDDIRALAEGQRVIRKLNERP